MLFRSRRKQGRGNSWGHSTKRTQERTSAITRVRWQRQGGRKGGQRITGVGSVTSPAAVSVQLWVLGTQTKCQKGLSKDGRVWSSGWGAHRVIGTTPRGDVPKPPRGGPGRGVVSVMVRNTQVGCSHSARRTSLVTCERGTVQELMPHQLHSQT